MGVNRDLKKATEAYWGGKLSQSDLLAEGKRLRLAHWKIQKDAGIDVIPSNDFSYYDQVLDHIQFFGVCDHYKLADHVTHVCRLLRRGTPSTSLIPLTNSLPWAGATKRTMSMYQRL